MKVLFITKLNECYGFVSYHRKNSGLFNSTRFIVEALRPRGIHAEIEIAIDNNCIDRLLRKHKPDVCVIEALWVVPEKFPILQALHPRVKFFVHMHSGLPFLALEGIAMDWLSRYPEVGVGVIANSAETYEAFRHILPPKTVTYLPNVYLPHFRKPVALNPEKQHLDVACFGAVRPMKNHLAQAIAAIELAGDLGKRLRFHINGTRVETGGQPVLKNLRQLFEHHPAHALVEHLWMEHDDFLHFLHRHMDIGMQVSLTETFNVVTADYVTAGIPVVVSNEIKWVSSFCQADDDSVEDMVRVMKRALKFPSLIRWNQQLLQWNSEEATQLWYEFCRHSVSC